MRSFEVPGVGGIMLAPATTEHKMFFTDGKEAFLYSDIKECVEKAKYILALPKEEADTIRARARERSLDDGYTYQQRARTAFKQFQDLYAQAGHHSF